MTAEAEELRDEARHFRSQLGRTARSRTTETGLDIIMASGTGPVNVDLWPTERPVVLALSSRTPVDWTLNLQEGARLERILILGQDGSAPPRILNAPPGVPVQSYDAIPLADAKDFGYYPRMARALHDLTGLTISTFQPGVASNGRVFVGAGGEWTYQNVLAEMLPVYERATAYERDVRRASAEGLRFTGVLRAPPDASDVITTIVDFDAFGVRGGGTRIRLDVGVRQIAVNTNDGRYFGVHAGNGSFGVGVGEIDPLTGVLAPLPGTPDAIAAPRRVGAVAYDSKRDRLVVTTLLDRSYPIYGYSTEDSRWSIIGTGDHTLDFSTLTYSEAHDALFGMTFGSTEIVRLDPSGENVGTIAISEFVPSSGDNQLFAIDDKLGLLTPPYADLDHPHLPPEQRFLLIEPTTGDVIYAGIVAIPEPGFATLLLSAAAAFGLARRRGRGGISET